MAVKQKAKAEGSVAFLDGPIICLDPASSLDLQTKNKVYFIIIILLWKYAVLLITVHGD